MIKPGDVLFALAYTVNSVGALTAADTIPTGALVHGLVGGTTLNVDTTVSVTVGTPIATGIYPISCTVPLTYSAGDTVILQVTATVGGVVSASALRTETVDVSRVSDIPGLILATPANKLATNSSGDVAVSNLPADYVSSTDITNIVTAIQGFVVETGLTFEQSIRLIVAASAGQVSGASGSTITISAANNPATTRIVATVDSSGDRTSLTLTP